MGKSLREWWNAPTSLPVSVTLVLAEAVFVVLAVATHYTFVAMVLSVLFLISLGDLRRAVRRYRSGRGRS